MQLAWPPVIRAYELALPTLLNWTPEWYRVGFVVENKFIIYACNSVSCLAKYCELKTIGKIFTLLPPTAMAAAPATVVLPFVSAMQTFQ